jgi:type II restriction enzyme
MNFILEEYGKTYKDRESVRRQVVHQLIQARVVDDNPGTPDTQTNNPQFKYALTGGALAVLRAFGTPSFTAEASTFLAAHGSLLEIYHGKRESQLVPVRLPSGDVLKLSPGKHNKLQAAVVEEFAARFAHGAVLLYIGDTARKHLLVESEALEKLRIPVTKHDKLPDVVFHVPARNWLLLVEAVTSHGPVSPKRKLELDALLSDCPLIRVYVSAFPDFKEFRRHANNIAWETEVWIAERPEHLIHFNGDKFLGPGQPTPPATSRIR